jgi:isocitrate dehydrogenase kinase/phosphatase
MTVFTLPSYPFVFKVIRDRFAPQKEVTEALVRRRYLQVKVHDRVGRMADTLEFSDVALPLGRFPPDLLRELQEQIPSKLAIEGEVLFIRHLYIEKRMAPLNLVLEQASPEETREVLDDWGRAIKELMGVNIFPGDLLFKNFGVSCSGKVVFYDYDEVCYLTQCNFRKIPEPRTLEDELASEPWYSVGPDDIFPEELPTFLTSDPEQRRLLRELHPELFDYRYWQRRQQDVKQGIHGDVFPYPHRVRFPRPEPIAGLSPPPHAEKRSSLTAA